MTRTQKADALSRLYEETIQTACDTLDQIIEDRKEPCPEIIGYHLKGESLKAWQALSELLYVIRCHTTEFGITGEQQRLLSKVGDAIGVDLI